MGQIVKVHFTVLNYCLNLLGKICFLTIFIFLRLFIHVSFTATAIVLTTHLILWHIWSQHFSAPPHCLDSSPVFGLIFCSVQPVKPPKGVCWDLREGCVLLHCFLNIIRPLVLSKNSGHSNKCNTFSGLYWPMGSTRQTGAWDGTAERAGYFWYMFKSQNWHLCHYLWAWWTIN